MLSVYLRLVSRGALSFIVNTDTLWELLQQLQRNDLDAEAAMKRLRPLVESAVVDPATAAAAVGQASANTSEACVDLDRRRRCGFSEVVYCEGKTAQAVVDVFAAQQAYGQDCLGTRVSDEQAQAVLTRFPQARHNSVARTISLLEDAPERRMGEVVVISAGTSDRPVAEEAVETLNWMRCRVDFVHDVGVAGPHRLFEQKHRFVGADAIIVVAGMEGALPSVVGGYVDCPVVAVPTSVGYGASFGGLAALLGMLNSCASNVTVVNIDAGFKAGYVAGLIASRAARQTEPDSPTNEP